jgi:leucyl-tRNA---protein transferase
VPLAPPHSIRLTTLPEHDCSYLPGKRAASRAFYADRLAPGVYHDFMDAGFRRSGKVIYQPTCAHCQACVPLRVLVNAFQPSKSQRRCARRNADLIVTQSAPTPTDEKFALYRRYVVGWHDKPIEGGDDDRESFEAFLYDSPVNTLEFNYRTKEGKLLAVGICDLCDRSFSSVYFYFDPDESRRGLGTFGALHELQWAKQAGIPYYYLGYWISGCGAMEYKANYHPNELLSPQGDWFSKVAFDE